MCIESKAAFGDVLYVSYVGFKNLYKGISIPANSATSAYSSTYSLTYTTSILSHFEPGRSYKITFPGYDFVSRESFSGLNVKSYTAYISNVKLISPDSSQTWSFSMYGQTITYNCQSKGSFTLSYDLRVSVVPVSSSQITSLNLDYSLYWEDVRIEDITPRTEKEVLEDIEKIDKEQLEQQKEQTETQKGIFGSIKDFFGSFFQNLIDSVIGLFVPSSDEMSGLFDELNQFFSDTFGFLYAPFDYLIQLVGVFLGSTGTVGLTFPGFSIMGFEVWPDLTYDIASDPVAGKVLEYVRIGTGILLAGWFIMYLQDFFKERFGSGSG